MIRDPESLNPFYNRAHRAERDISEMLGLVKGILADGVVTEGETTALGQWIIAHPQVADVWPGNMILRRLNVIFEDGRVDDDERADLAALLQELVGGKTGIVAGEVASTSLPIDDPPPAITHPGHEFVFTGRFALGPRGACEEQARDRGASVNNNVTGRTDYLVIGTFASEAWIQTSYGRKIEKAVKYRHKGEKVAIVSEDHWADSL